MRSDCAVKTFNSIFIYYQLTNYVLFYGINSTSLRVVVGQRFFIPVVGQLVFVENGRDDDRINNYAFM